MFWDDKTSESYQFVTCEDFIVCKDYRFKKNWGLVFIIPNIYRKPLSFVKSSAFVKTLIISSWKGIKIILMLPLRIWSLIKWYLNSMYFILECLFGLCETEIALSESQ